MRIPARYTLRAFYLLAASLLIACITVACQRHGEAVLAQEIQPISLPAPQTSGGLPLQQALLLRHTTRAFRDAPLSAQSLSNLLWAAFGVNRPRSVMPGLGRTAPSAMNSQDIELEVLLAQGLYVYDAEHNLLRPLRAGDLRGSVSPAPAARAAVTLVYVAADNDRFAQVDCGFIGQNVYLFAASEGLNAWFYAIHPDAVTAALHLSAGRVPLYAQSVGYPPQ